jgi:hypothetical protein
MFHASSSLPDLKINTILSDRCQGLTFIRK